jgi:hypothetical protein
MSHENHFVYHCRDRRNGECLCLYLQYMASWTLDGETPRQVDCTTVSLSERVCRRCYARRVRLENDDNFTNIMDR